MAVRAGDSRSREMVGAGDRPGGWASRARGLGAHLCALAVGFGASQVLPAAGFSAGAALSRALPRGPGEAVLALTLAASGFLGGALAGLVLGLLWPRRWSIAGAGVVGAGLAWAGVGMRPSVRKMFLPLLLKDASFLVAVSLCLLAVIAGYAIAQRRASVTAKAQGR